MCAGKKGFTLIEILIVISILGVLTTLAIPTFTNTVERSRANEAITNLNIISAAEKIYKLNHGVYYSVAGPYDAAKITTINTNLNIDISPRDYPITSMTSVSGTSYVVTMTRGTNTVTMTTGALSCNPTNLCS